MTRHFKKLRPFLIHGIAVLAGLLFHFAVVRILGAKEAGIFYAGFAMYSVFVMLSVFGQQKGLISNRYFREGGNFRFILKNIFLGWLSAVLFWQVIVRDVSSVFIVAALLSSCAVSLGIYYQDRRLFFLSSIFQQYGIKITAILLLLMFGSRSSDALSYSLILAAGLLIVIGLCYLPRPDGLLLAPNKTAQLTQKALIPFWVISVLAVLFESAPIYLAAVLSNPEFVATLAVVIKLSAFGSFSLVAVNKFSIVSYADKPDDHLFLRQKSAKFGFAAFVIALPILGLLFFGAEYVLSLFSEELTSGGNLLRWCLLLPAINLLTGQSSTLLMVAGRVDITLRNQVISGGVLALLCSLALFYRTQEFVVAAFVFPAIVNNILNCLAARKVLGFWTFVRVPR